MTSILEGTSWKGIHWIRHYSIGKMHVMYSHYEKKFCAFYSVPWKANPTNIIGYYSNAETARKDVEKALAEEIQRFRSLPYILKRAEVCEVRAFRRYAESERDKRTNPFDVEST